VKMAGPAPGCNAVMTPAFIEDGNARILVTCPTPSMTFSRMAPMRIFLPLLMLTAGAAAVSAQSVPAPASTPNAEYQIASAISPLPQEFRATAQVLGYRAGTSGLVELRAGNGPFICLADDPNEQPRFHVACYHRTMEPFMLRGRELRAKGVSGAAMDSLRNAEATAGKIKMPALPASLYSHTSTTSAFDLATGTTTGARALFVVYVPFATPETTGFVTRPAGNTPWLMNPGTPKAHIMFSPTM
jgi:hypothetical protein